MKLISRIKKFNFFNFKFWSFCKINQINSIDQPMKNKNNSSMKNLIQIKQQIKIINEIIRLKEIRNYLKINFNLDYFIFNEETIKKVKYNQ